MFRGTKSILNGQTNGKEECTEEERNKKKKGKRQREEEETEVQTEKKVKLENEEESSGADENNPKKFNWELQIRKHLVMLEYLFIGSEVYLRRLAKMHLLNVNTFLLLWKISHVVRAYFPQIHII